MRILTAFAAIIVGLAPLGAHAQCFNRNVCNDPNTLEIRSQITVNVPVAEHASASDAMKAVISMRSRTASATR